MYVLAGNPVFTSVNDQVIIDLIRSNNIILHNAIRRPLLVMDLDSEELNRIVDAAQSSIFKNIRVVQEIIDVNEEDLRVFFSGIRLFSYDGADLLGSLSSFDGSRVYLKQKIINDPKLVESTQESLEREYMNCLSCWGKFDPYLVSSWSNPNLRSCERSNVKVGAGHFYQERVFGHLMTCPSPFQLNAPYKCFRE